VVRNNNSNIFVKKLTTSFSLYEAVIYQAKFASATVETFVKPTMKIRLGIQEHML
jgi:hypothetical protein